MREYYSPEDIGNLIVDKNLSFRECYELLDYSQSWLQRRLSKLYIIDKKLYEKAYSVAMKRKAELMNNRVEEVEEDKKKRFIDTCKLAIKEELTLTKASKKFGCCSTVFVKRLRELEKEEKHKELVSKVRDTFKIAKAKAYSQLQEMPHVKYVPSFSELNKNEQDALILLSRIKKYKANVKPGDIIKYNKIRIVTKQRITGEFYDAEEVYEEKSKVVFCNGSYLKTEKDTCVRWENIKAKCNIDRRCKL